MKHLAYCILPEPKLQQAVLPCGPDGVLLSAVVENGLAIVFAQVPDAAAQPTVPQLLAYARVIEALHRQCPVLPMRFGCLFENGKELCDFLHKRQAIFQPRLRELDGCSEISVRVMHADGPGEESKPPSIVELKNTGAAYLAARRASYLLREHQSQKTTLLGDKLRQAFQGLFRAFRTDQYADKGGSVVSFHFLVSSENTDPFRAAFHQFQLESSLKVRLSGPWPPYNFANCE